MKIKKKLCTAILLATAIGLTGCVKAVKTWNASGGSKADGSVKLSYIYNSFEVPEADDKQGQAVAIKRCQAWGYKSAEAFDMVTTKCQNRGGYGNCVETLVTKEYQCL